MTLMLHKYVITADEINRNKPQTVKPSHNLFTRPVRGLLPGFSTQPIMCDSGECDHAALKDKQPQADNEIDFHVNMSLLPTR